MGIYSSTYASSLLNANNHYNEKVLGFVRKVISAKFSHAIEA
jgi:hypothetical protein